MRTFGILALLAVSMLPLAGLRAAPAHDQAAASTSNVPSVKETVREAGTAAQRAGAAVARDAKAAWKQAGTGFREAGRTIGAGARSFGRATHQAFQTGWRSVTDAFAAPGARPKGASPG